MAGRPESSEGGVAGAGGAGGATTDAMGEVREGADGGRIVIRDGGRDIDERAVDGVEDWL